MKPSPNRLQLHYGIYISISLGLKHVIIMKIESNCWSVRVKCMGTFIKLNIEFAWPN